MTKRNVENRSNESNCRIGEEEKRLSPIFQILATLMSGNGNRMTHTHTHTSVIPRALNAMMQHECQHTWTINWRRRTRSHASARTFRIQFRRIQTNIWRKRTIVSRSSFVINESKLHSKLHCNCKSIVIYVKTTNQNSFTLLIYI